MQPYSLSHLLDHDLLADLHAIVRQDRATTARLLAHLAEVEARGLYLPAACSSLYAYCVGELRMPEDMAWRRATAASLARRFPALFPALADGRLNLSTVLLLAPHLKSENAGELLVAAANKSKREVQHLVAERFPQPDVPTMLQPIMAAAVSASLAACEADVHAARTPAEQVVPAMSPSAANDMEPPAPARVVPSNQPESSACTVPLSSPPAPRHKLAPLAVGRYALQVTVNQTTHDLLLEAQALLGHTTSAGDVASVLERALSELVERLRKRKHAETSAPRPGRRSASCRHVPAEIKREVWNRDSGQCTFVSVGGKRCEACHRLEYDHVVPLARGGQTTAENLRLRCCAHNQHGAEQAYGAEFMREQRERARRAAVGRRESAGPRGHTAGGITSAVSAPGAPA